MAKLFIASSPAYVWRVHSWGMGENHNHIPCWYVVTEENKVVSGGYYSGMNTQSGYAHISRKKDAVALVQGYNWAKNNLSEIDEKVSYDSAPKDSSINPFGRYKESERDQHAFFNEGVHIARLESTGKRFYSQQDLTCIKRLYKKQYTI